MESLEAASLDLAAAIDSVFKVRAGAYTTSAAAPSRRLPVSRALPRPQVVFVHRYRDTAGAIRVDVLSAFGQWLSADPGTFVHNAYLKYVGWMLSDQLDPDVRVQVRAGRGGEEGQGILQRLTSLSYLLAAGCDVHRAAVRAPLCRACAPG